MPLILVVGVGNIEGATYYSKTAGNANLLATWGQNADGTGAAPVNFTTSGDIFILRSVSVLTISANWTVDIGVTLQVDGIFTIAGGNNDDFVVTINGTTIFTATNSSQAIVSSTSGNPQTTNTFNLGSSAKLLTANVNGIAGTNCSISTLTSGRAITTLSSAANYEFNGANQNTLGLPSTIANLTLSGSGVKTFATTPTVNGILSMEGTASVIVTTGVVTYGPNATLQYNTATARSASSEEWPATFSSSGGVIITNTGAITSNGHKVFDTGVPLTIQNGATFLMANYKFTFNGDLVNNGGTISGTTGGVEITGTANQSIGSFTTTGTVSMTKTGGTATFNGNINSGSLTIDGNGGTLDLGAGFTHTITGALTRTIGALLGNSSTLNIGGNTTNTGGTFTAGTSTVNYTKNTVGAQNIANVAYNNLIFSGTEPKIIAAGTSVAGNLTISTPAANASIGTGLNISVGSLTFGSTNQICGTWGYGPATPPTNKDQNYFAASTGYLTVGSPPDAPTSVLPVSGVIICTGSSINLNATSSGNTINWYTVLTGGTSIGNSASGASFSVSPTISTTYYAEAQTAGGCASTNRTASGLVTVNPLPTAAGAISGASTVTAGQTAVAYSVTAIANATSYTWVYSGTGATISGSTASMSISFAANATSGNLTVYGANSCGSGAISANFPVTVNAPVPCAYSGNTASSQTNYLPCINLDLPGWINTVSNSIAPRQYFIMNVIKGINYQIYTCESGLLNQLQLTVYEEGQASNPPLAFSYSNAGSICADVNNVYLSYTAGFSGKIRFLINRIGDCGATTPNNIDVRVRVDGGINIQDNQTIAGDDRWVGHIYDGDITTIKNTLFNQNFSGYLGYYTEAETFDQSFGGSSNNNCYSSVYSAGEIRATLNTQTFSVRYRMNSTKKGLYVVDLGSDDGGRLAVDGSLIYDNWSDHGYLGAARTLLSLTGSSSLVYDFYENGVDNRVTFNNLILVLENTLSANTNQTICLGGDGLPVSGDQFGSLPGGISLSGTGYQWAYSTTPGGIHTNIPGATSATYTPTTQSAPFNTTGTFYLYRNAILSSVNNYNPNPYVATNVSNAAILTVEESDISGTSSGSSCGTGSVTLQATTSTGTVEWYNTPSGGTLLYTGNTFTTPVITTTTTYYAQPTSGGCLGTRIPVNAYIQTLPEQSGAISGATSTYQGTSQTYSVPNVPGITYNWTFPAGWVQTAGGTTSSVTVTIGSVTGNVSVIPSNSCGNGNAQTLAVTVYSLGISVTKTDLCLSGATNTGTISATGVGGQTPYQYKLNTGTYQASGNFTTLAAGTYVVWVKDAGGIETSATVTLQVPVVSNDSQARAGSDSWIGHVYKRSGTGNSPADANAFASYYGTITGTETFNELFGGTQICFPVAASESARTVYSEYFSVRYRMGSTKSGIYLADIGSDDGARLTVDGTKVYDRWIDRSYIADLKILFQLDGTSNLLFDFYETGGGNQVSFQNFQKVVNDLSTGTAQTICQGAGTLAAITGNNSLTDAPISSTSGFTVTYQWQQASVLAGPFADISGITTQNYTPIVTLPGTYYYRRKLTVIKTNPGMPTGTNIPVTAISYSNVATINIITSPVATFNYAGSPFCKDAPNPSPTFSGGGTAGVFSSTAGLVFVSMATGQVDLASSTAGTYTVTNTIAASGGCPQVSATSSVTIAPLVHTNVISQP